LPCSSTSTPRAVPGGLPSIRTRNRTAAPPDATVPAPLALGGVSLRPASDRLFVGPCKDGRGLWRALGGADRGSTDTKVRCVRLSIGASCVIGAQSSEGGARWGTSFAPSATSNPQPLAPSARTGG
jgi:hypothetical protein